MMIRKLAISAMLAATTALVSSAAATTAQAEPATANGAGNGLTAAVVPPSVQDCPVHYACLWTNTDWRDGRWQGQWQNDRLPGFIDQKSNSSANHSLTNYACFWTEQYGQGQVFAEGPGSIRQNLSLDPRPVGKNWANVIRSLTWKDC
jgi:hypothetical protein